MTPSISIIIPVFNDAIGLKTTVASLAGQTLDHHRYEILVVDNGSNDDTWTVAQRLAAEYPNLIYALQEADVQGSYAARNRGIHRATGHLFCFIDADMWAPPDYLEMVQLRFRDERLDYLACDVEIVIDDPTTAALYNWLNGFPIETYLRKDHYAPTCCLCIRRRCIDEVGPFDLRLESGGDMEFGQRVFEAGLHQDFAPEIQLRHPARTSYASLVAKHRRIARGHAQLSHHYPDRYSLFGDLYLANEHYLLPMNPITLTRRAAAMGAELSWNDALRIALLPIPLSWSRLAAYLEEARNLAAS